MISREEFRKEYPDIAALSPFTISNVYVDDLRILDVHYKKIVTTETAKEILDEGNWKKCLEFLDGVYNVGWADYIIIANRHAYALDEDCYDSLINGVYDWCRVNNPYALGDTESDYEFDSFDDFIEGGN